MKYPKILQSFRRGAKTRVAQQTFWMGMITAVQTVNGIVMVMLAARILGPEGFGLLSIFIGTAALLHGFLSAPGHETITAFVTKAMIAEREADAAAVLRMVLVAACALALCAYVLFALLALTASELVGIADTHADAMLVCGLASLSMTAYREFLATLRLANRLAFGFMAVVAGTVFRSAALFAVWRLDGDLMLTSLAVAGGAAVTGAGLFAAVTLSSGRGNLPRFLRVSSIAVPKDVIRFHFISFCQGKFGALFGNLDVVLLGALAGPTQAGFYRAARRLVETTVFIGEPLAMSAQTEYSRRWHNGDSGSVRRLSRRLTILAATLAMLIYGSLLIGHGPIIRIVLGPGFEEVATPLLVMIPGAFIFMSIAALYVLPAAAGHAMPSLIWTSTALVAQAAALMLLAPSYGANGAALAYTIYYLVFLILVAIFVVLLLPRTANVSD